MAQPIHKFKQIACGKVFSIAVIVLALFARAIQLIYFFNLRSDISYQTIATHNFITGHGISMAYADPANPGVTHFDTLINWPPGYSILLAPFYILFGKNYIPASLCLFFISMALLIFSTRAILRIFKVHKAWINLYTLLTTVFIYYFYLILSTDAIAISFFVSGIYFFLRLVHDNNTAKRDVFFLYLFLLSCLLLKYLFIPLIFILPLSLYYFGSIKKHVTLRNAGLQLLGLLIISCAILFIYQKQQSGSAVYISSTQRGFYPEQLLKAFPFLIASFLRPDTLSYLVSHNQFVFTLFQWVNCLLLLGSIIWLVSQLTNKLLSHKNLFRPFLVLNAILILVLVFFLGFLSLTIRSEDPGGIGWTYLEEPRYFGLVNVLLQLSLAIGLWIYYRDIHKKVKLVLVIPLILMLPEIIRGTVFLTNRIRLHKKEEYSWQGDLKFQEYADSLIKQIHASTVVTGPYDYLNNRVSLYSHIPILRESYLLNEPLSFKSAKPTVLLLVLSKKDKSSFQPFLSRPENKIAGQFGDIYFYIVYVAATRS